MDGLIGSMYETILAGDLAFRHPRGPGFMWD